MKQRRAFDQLTLLQLNQPGFALRAMERAALVPLVRRMLLEIFVQRSRAHVRQGER